MTPTEIDEVARLVERDFPGVPVLRMSAKTGEGFESLAALLEQTGAFGRKILDIDYDIYAEGEAELGWLNSGLDVTADTPFAMDALLLDTVTALQEALRDEVAEVAHLKAIGLGEATFGVANLVATGQKPELSLPSKAKVKVADLIVNARVAVDPARLEALVRAGGADGMREARGDGDGSHDAELPSRSADADAPLRDWRRHDGETLSHAGGVGAARRHLARLAAPARRLARSLRADSLGLRRDRPALEPARASAANRGGRARGGSTRDCSPASASIWRTSIFSPSPPTASGCATRRDIRARCSRQAPRPRLALQRLGEVRQLARR